MTVFIILINGMWYIGPLTGPNLDGIVIGRKMNDLIFWEFSQKMIVFRLIKILKISKATRFQ
jgi:hypothetical protein